MSENQNRQPAGVPTGGQFAATQRAEADVALSTDTPTSRQQRLDAILDNQAEAAGDDFDEFDGYGSYGGEDFRYEVQQVADALYNHYAYRDDTPHFNFGFDSSSDGEVSGYMVTADCGDGVTLAHWGDLKNATTDRSATGRDAARAITEALDGDYQRLVAKAREKGLYGEPAPAEGRPDADAARRALAAWDATPEHEDIDVDTMAAVRDHLAAYVADDTGAPRKSPWPETDDEKVAYLDWKCEADNGDTVASFRDWYEDPDRDLNYGEDED
jgi:hypothetical protein